MKPTYEPDENAVRLVRLACDNRGHGTTCDCAPGTCNDASAWAAAAWMETAAALGVPTAALAALARGEAVVVPKLLTVKMAANSVRAIVPGTSTPLWVKFADAGLTAECLMPAWDAALDASPYKGGA